MNMIIFGVIAIVVAGVLLFLMKKKQEKLNVLLNYENTTATEIKQNHAYFKEEFGAGTYSHAIEINGVVTCENPVTAEMSKEPVAYFHNKVVREIERKVRKKDKDGNYYYTTQTSTEHVSSNKRSAEFGVKDNTGEILVDIDGAEVHPVKVFSDYEKGETPSSRFNVNIGSFSVSSGSDTRVLGYRYEEYAIPLNTRLYVLGWANDKSGYLKISRPTDKSPFIVSTKSEEEIQSGIENSIKMFKYIAIGLVVAGVGMIIAGIFQ